jgi:membrane protease YdiL (CAAX protease family)
MLRIMVVLLGCINAISEPIMNQNFEQYIQPAFSETRWWKLLLTLVLWFLGYFLLSSIVLALLPMLLDIPGLDDLSNGKFTTPISVYFLLLTFVIWVGVFWAAVALFHKRGIRSLLGGPRTRFLKCFVWAVVISGVFLITTQALFPSNDRIVENITLWRWLALLPIGLMLMLVQVSAEELLFRGYLQQQFAAWVNNRFFYMVIPSILFGCAHFSTELGVSVGWMIVGVTGILGLFLADLTYRTGNLGAAIGVHFANNFGAMFYVSYQEQISGLARYVAPDYFDKPELMAGAAGTMLISSGIMFAIYFAIMEWRERR